MPGRDVNTTDFPNDNSGNDAQSSDDIFVAQEEQDRKAIDDIIITGSVSEIDKFKNFLKSKFMIKDLRKLKIFFGIEVIDSDKGICLNQRKYVLNLLFEYGMLSCKPTRTPLMTKITISKEASHEDPLLDNITDYQKLRAN
nr:ribonuclease H-like domain-containing protein [Tanacetum cinerariifolium]GEZ03304.1 ribonuclease H-like domain-containing protein [Tanacetum cinerariifolium]